MKQIARSRPARKIFPLPLLSALLIIPVLQLGGCSRSSTSAGPGGTYLSTSAGARFTQSVGIAGEEEAFIASFPLQQAHRPAHSPQTVYVAAGNRGVVISDNGGESWRVIATPLSSALDVVELKNGTLVVTGLGPENQGFIIRSLDGGLSWQNVLTIPVPEDEDEGVQIVGRRKAAGSVVLSIEPDPLNEDRIYAGSNLGSIFIGEQSAKLWRSTHTLQPKKILGAHEKEKFGIRRLIPSPHVAGELLVITNEDQLWRIKDGVQTEIKIPEEPNPQNRFANPKPRRVLDIAFIPDAANALLAGIQDGVAVSRDEGASWEDLNLPIETNKAFNSMEVAVSPTNTNRILVAVNEVVYRSEDAGQNWNTHSLRLPAHIITDILIDPSNAARVLVVTQQQET